MPIRGPGVAGGGERGGLQWTAELSYAPSFGVLVRMHMLDVLLHINGNARGQKLVL